MNKDSTAIPHPTDTTAHGVVPNLRTEYGLTCPDCGCADSLTIDISCSAQLTVDGTTTLGDHYWDDTSSCFCDECGLNDTVGGFRIAETATP